MLQVGFHRRGRVKADRLTDGGLLPANEQSVTFSKRLRLVSLKGEGDEDQVVAEYRRALLLPSF